MCFIDQVVKVNKDFFFKKTYLYSSSVNASEIQLSFHMTQVTPYTKHIKAFTVST